MRHKQVNIIPLQKTYYFLLLIENKKLTKIVSLTSNDLETSGLLYSAMFCINQKNTFFICKSSVFFLITKVIPLKNRENQTSKQNSSHPFIFKWLIPCKTIGSFLLFEYGIKKMVVFSYENPMQNDCAFS